LLSPEQGCSHLRVEILLKERRQANTKDKICLDGRRFVDWDNATIHVAALALYYGSSVFKGARADSTPSGAAIRCLDANVQRLYASAKMFKIPIPFAPHQIRNAIIGVVRVNELDSGCIRPLAFRGSENFSLDPRKCPFQVVILAFPWGRYLGPESIEQGIDAGVSS